MNVINIGGWFVGNSAILDWMDGFEELAFIKGDFNVMRLEGGIMDMISEVNVENKLAMIKRQKAECYKGFYKSIIRSTGRYTKRLMKPKPTLGYNWNLRFHIVYYHYLATYQKQLLSGEHFNEVDYWREWMDTLPKLESKNKNSQHVIYQNPFFYDETFDGHKDVWPELFSPYKMIFVHRDPMDQFSDIVNSGSHLYVSWPRFHGGTEEMHPADRFLAIAKKLYEARLRMAENYTAENLVIFSFEDFINEHERISTRLKQFLNIQSTRNAKNKRFVREQSMKNIGKGQHNEQAKKLLEGKPYVMAELNELRDKLIKHPLSI